MPEVSEQIYQDSVTPLYKYLVAKDTAVSVTHLYGTHKMYVIFGGSNIKQKAEICVYITKLFALFSLYF